MKTKNLIILLIVAAVVCLAAIVLHRKETSYKGPSSAGEGPARGDALLPAVAERVDDIDRVEYTKDGETVVLQRDENRDWQIASTAGYPADEKKMKKMVFELTSMKVGDRLTDNTEKYGNFGLEGEEGEQGRLVLYDKLGKEVATLMLGGGREASSGGDEPPTRFDTGRYVRTDADPAVYLVEQEMSWLSTRVSNWIETEIANIESATVAFVMVDCETTDTLHVSWESGSPEMLKPDMPEGKRLKTYEVNSMRSALSNLRINDVLPADGATSITFPTVYHAQARTGVYYHVSVGEYDGKHYIKLSSEYTVAVPSDEDMASTMTELAARDRAKEAERMLPAFNERHEPWVYEVSEWVAGKFTKGPADVLEPAPTPTPAPAPAPAEETTEAASAADAAPFTLEEAAPEADAAEEGVAAMETQPEAEEAAAPADPAPAEPAADAPAGP